MIRSTRRLPWLPTALLCAGLLSACGDKDTGGAASSDDADADGFPADVDCNDGDAAIFPGADELCNDVDDDCDGDVDEAPTEGPTWYVDADGDGRGNADYPVISCTQPEGMVDNADDCDDASAVSYPGADELCDGLDNDCDGQIDDDPVDSPTYYVDEDGDGYGNPDVPIQVCGAPDVYVTNGDDCDDSDPDLNPDTTWYGDVDGDGYGGSLYTAHGCDAPKGHVGNSDDCADDDADIHPGAEEVCDDQDNDCDGTVDGETATDALTFYEDVDLDGYGVDGKTTLACTAPEGFAEELGDCNDGDDSINPGALERCGDDIDNNCDDDIDVYCQLSLDDADLFWEGEASNDYAGYQVAAGGDYDGDGLPDVAIGAYGADVTAATAGRGYLVVGAEVAGTTRSLADALLIVDGASSNDYLGYAVGLGPDVTGDGYGDAVFAGWGVDSGSDSGVGGAFVFAGPTAGSFVADEVDADAVVLGTASLDYLAQYQVVVGGDLDHDGQGDLVIGAAGEDTPYSAGGLLAVFAGPVSGQLDPDTADARIEATGSAHYVGFSAAVDDVDGDGLDDIAWGTSGDTAAYVLFGPVSGTVDATDADVSVDATASDSLGSDIALGDFDGDGATDLAIGAKYDSTIASNNGAWFVLAGDLSGSYTTDDAVFKVTEVDSGTYLGAQYDSVGVGDVDASGADDLFVGSPGNGFVGSASGGGFIFLGPLSGTTDVAHADMGLLGTSGSSAAGYGLDLADLDGDGADDAVIGARGWSSSAGRVYGVFGAGF